MKVNGRLTIVMYHYVRDLENSKYPEIKGLDTSLFMEQISYLKKNYNILSMEEIIDFFLNKEDLPANSVLLTFDDGLVDHYKTVFPILLENKLQGSFYIPSQCIEELKVLDVNKIHYILACGKDINVIYSHTVALIEQWREKFNLVSHHQLFSEYSGIGYHLDSPQVRFIKQILQVALPIELRKIILEDLFKTFVSLNEADIHSEIYLDKAQLREMLSEGMHIGAHGHTHSWLNSLDVSAQRSELSSSVDFLKSLGVSSRYYSLCYPFGGYNKETLKLASAMNFKLGLTTEVEIADIYSHSLLALPRLDTNDLPKERLAIKNKWFERQING